MLLDIVEPFKHTENKEKPCEIAIGIDLGTTNSLVAISENQIPYIIPILDQSGILPSVVKINDVEIKSIKRLTAKSYEEVVGLLDSNPDLKKYLIEDSDSIKFLINGREITPTEVSSQILLELKHAAERYCNKEIKKAVITIPAYFDDAARNSTKQAAEMAGFEVLRLLAEPTAAAYAYGLENGKEGMFLVYDFGGGTFDVSLLNMQMGVFQVIATGGDLNLGGDDIDLEIVNYISSKYNLDPAQIFGDAKTAKEYLAYHEVFSCKGFILTLSEFEEIISPIINRTIKIIEGVIESSGVDIEDIEGIILVGGSTRIKLVKDLIKEKFGLKIFDDVDPDKVVALGAALQAENLTKGSSNLLIDVSPLSLGIELFSGLVDVVIPRNSPLPATNSTSFTTQEDNQTGMKFHVVQGDRALAKDCRSLANFELAGIPQMKAGMARISVKFYIDVDGILSVTATEMVTGVSQQITLKPSYGLNESQVIEMLKAAFEKAKEDHQKSLLIKIKNESIDLIKALKKIDVLQECSDYILDLEEKMQDDDYEAIDISLQKLKKFSIGLFNDNLKKIMRIKP